jgi:O-acetylhomoserine/O-acetylserine sulfhydrylase-like pyridoxal-dependent enzyme
MTTTTDSSGVQAYIARGAQMMEAAARQRARMRTKRFDTIAVHGLYNMETALANQGSIIEPGYFTTSQHFENSDHMETALAYQMPSWAYARIANPTQGYLEETLALLEGYGYAGEVSATVTSSGMAAIFMATNPFLMQEGGGNGRAPARINIVASAKCYGGTFMLFSQRYQAERGIEVRWVSDPLNLDEWAKQIDAGTRFVFGEMPSNPGLGLFDIAGLAEIAHRHNLPLIVDSTVATPALLRPLQHGADIVVHSLSKTMGSSGMAIAGAVIARHNIPSRVGPDDLRVNFALYVKLLPLRDHGPGLSPFSALMIMNDLRTLRSKIDHMSRSSEHVAAWLSEHPAVETVNYPGLANFEGHAVAHKYMWLVDSEQDICEQDICEQDTSAPINRYGHLLSFTVKGGVPATRRLFDRLQMIWRATDLGRIKSVATIPAISTHQQQGEAGRSLAQVPGNLVRLNVGGEHPLDIIADLEQALD